MATIHQKKMLLKGLLKGTRAFTGPFHVAIDVTSRCNLQCFGCRFHSASFNNASAAGRNVPDIPLELFGRICAQLRSVGTKTIILSGEGEPLLHPGIFDMIARAKSFGFQVALISNGTLLDGKTSRELLLSGLDVFRVSLWAFCPEDYEKAYPGTDIKSFYRVLEGLNSLRYAMKEAGTCLPKVAIHHPVSKRNFNNIRKIVGLAKAVGVDRVSFSPFLSTRGRLSSDETNLDMGSSLVDTFKILKKELDESSIAHNIGQLFLRYKFVKRSGEWPFPCYAGWYHSRISVDGTVFPCGSCDFRFGNLRDETFSEIWNGPAYRDFRRRTITRAGLLLLDSQCDCEYCCCAEDNFRVDRIFRWIPRFLSSKHTV